MKKSVIVIGVIAVILILLFTTCSGKYNEMVSLNEDANTKLSQIDTALQRRADLIPNLVNTVKGYMKHEEKVINDISTARSNLVSANNVNEKSKANNELTKAINNLFLIVERYPDLKANTNFINLQDELAGTENRIAVARKDYNEAVKTYNVYIKEFPNNLIAKLFNYENKDYFKADESKKDVPNVEF